MRRSFFRHTCSGGVVMDRRSFLQYSSVAGALCAAGLPVRAETVSSGWRTFELITEVHIPQTADGVRIWVPVPYSNDTPYQRAVQTRWDISGGGQAQMLPASQAGVEMVEIGRAHV